MAKRIIIYIPDFGSVKTCPKCNQGVISGFGKYCVLENHFQTPGNAEVMRRECFNCKYEWYEDLPVIEPVKEDTNG